MLSRKYVTTVVVTIVSSGQAGARISPKGAQQLRPKLATHEPPSCAPKPAGHHPLPKPALHHQAESTNAAQRRHRNQPSRNPKCSTEATHRRLHRCPRSRKVGNHPLAWSHRSSKREPWRSQADELPPPCVRGRPGPAAACHHGRHDAAVVQKPRLGPASPRPPPPPRQATACHHHARPPHATAATCPA
jgi:hypothetical protein